MHTIIIVGWPTTCFAQHCPGSSTGSPTSWKNPRSRANLDGRIQVFLASTWCVTLSTSLVSGPHVSYKTGPSSSLLVPWMASRFSETGHKGDSGLFLIDHSPQLPLGLLKPQHPWTIKVEGVSRIIWSYLLSSSMNTRPEVRAFIHCIPLSALRYS